jgi:hypothetical protein
MAIILFVFPFHFEALQEFDLFRLALNAANISNAVRSAINHIK